MEDCRDLIIDERTWQAIHNSKTADALALSLFIIKEAIDSGPDEVREASNALLANIEAVYLHTDAHKAALKLYLLSLTGQLKPQDEPLQLINEAIERGMAQITRNRRASRKRGR